MTETRKPDFTMLTWKNEGILGPVTLIDEAWALEVNGRPGNYAHEVSMDNWDALPPWKRRLPWMKESEAMQAAETWGCRYTSS